MTEATLCFRVHERRDAEMRAQPSHAASRNEPTFFRFVGVIYLWVGETRFPHVDIPAVFHANKHLYSKKTGRL